MRSHLYPAFTMEPEDFERALPAAIKFSQTHDIPCRVIRDGETYTICFEDKAVSRGFVYGHQHEKELDRKFRKYAMYDVFYLNKEDFAKGLSCDRSE